jgi:hypothetical protein
MTFNCGWVSKYIEKSGVGGGRWNVKCKISVFWILPRLILDSIWTKGFFF